MKAEMNFTAFMRDLFFVETETVLSFAIIGSIFARDASITYVHFFIPLVMGFIYMLPCIPVYVKEDMTIPQVIVQRVAELIVLEVICIYVGNYLAGKYLDIPGLIGIGVSVVFFDVLSYYFAYRMEKAESEKLNKKITMLVEARNQSKAQAGGTSAQGSDTKDSSDYKIDAIGDKGSHIRLPLEGLLYLEADGEQVFAYTTEEIYKVNMRLYQVETLSKKIGIVRVSKSHLVNLQKIQSVRPALNSRLYAKMPNGEEVLVSRKYAPILKQSIS